ncbi:MAG: hypothetical protein V1773_17165 [bacterium]
MTKEETPLIEKQFCTECGDDLTEFYMSERVKHVEEVKANFENCKKTGKFKGEECSKLFIASDEDVFIPDEDI